MFESHQNKSKHKFVDKILPLDDVDASDRRRKKLEIKPVRSVSSNFVLPVPEWPKTLSLIRLSGCWPGHSCSTYTSF